MNLMQLILIRIPVHSLTTIPTANFPLFWFCGYKQYTMYNLTCRILYMYIKYAL